MDLKIIILIELNQTDKENIIYLFSYIFYMLNLKKSKDKLICNTEIELKRRKETYGYHGA